MFGKDFAWDGYYQKGVTNVREQVRGYGWENVAGSLLAAFVCMETKEIGGTLPLMSPEVSRVLNTTLVFDPQGNEAARYQLPASGGTLDTHGEIEYAPKAKNVRVDDLAIRGVHVDYIHTAATAQAETARKEKVATAAKKATNSRIWVFIDSGSWYHSRIEKLPPLTEYR